MVNLKPRSSAESIRPPISDLRHPNPRAGLIDPRIKFRHLSCFLEVARQRGFVKAATILNITQPAVSKTLKELEDILGVRLFERSRSGVTLTRFGAVFLRYAGSSATALRQGLDSLRQAGSGAGISINIGALPTVAARLIPQALHRFKSAHPESAISVTTGLNTDLLSRLRVGDLDLVVGRMAAPELMAGLSFQYLYTEHISFLVRPGHPLLASDVFDFRRLENFTVLVPHQVSIIRPYVDRLLIANGMPTLNNVIETVSMAFGRHYARKYDAVWIISRGVAADDIDDGLLLELPIDTSDYPGPVGLTSRADLPPGPALENLMHSIRDISAGPAA